ncbi:MAG: acetyl-CoA carboxylase carboxyltransferase subunit alpha [Clostridia bacterium]|nr:acetyl-CoA carboxylase carboxyltransferase subunit alpha [Clostridia bacterium]
MNAYECLQKARAKDRPTASCFIEHIFSGFCELHGDRLFGDDRAVMGGIAWLDELPVTVIGIEKGRDTNDKVARNFGSAHPEGYRKALRLMKQAEKFKRPVVCFVDTSGAFCGIGAEERGQGRAIAENLMEMMRLRVPVISVIIGEGGSGGALALAVADEVWMLQNAVYSVLSPEGAASIIWKDASKVEEAANSLHMTSEDLKTLGIIERIFKEPAEGEGFETVYSALKSALKETLTKNSALSVDALLDARYEKFRKIGRDGK